MVRSPILASSNTLMTLRAAHMICTQVFFFGTAHKAMAQFDVVNHVLSKQVPSKVLLVALASLGWVGAGMSHVPKVPGQSILVHSLANGMVACTGHSRHHFAIELADAVQVIA